MLARSLEGPWNLRRDGRDWTLLSRLYRKGGPIQDQELYYGQLTLLGTFEVRSGPEGIWGQDVVAEVQILVTAMPARFWEFRIQRPQHQVIKLTSGSGTLSDYWPAVVQLSQGMLEIVKS